MFNNYKTVYSHFQSENLHAQGAALTVGAVFGAGLCSGARPSSLAFTDWRIAKIFLAKFWKTYWIPVNLDDKLFQVILIHMEETIPLTCALQKNKSLGHELYQLMFLSTLLQLVLIGLFYSKQKVLINLWKGRRLLHDQLIRILSLRYGHIFHYWLF